MIRIHGRMVDVCELFVEREDEGEVMRWHSRLPGNFIWMWRGGCENVEDEGEESSGRSYIAQ